MFFECYKGDHGVVELIGWLESIRSNINSMGSMVRTRRNFNEFYILYLIMVYI